MTVKSKLSKNFKAKSALRMADGGYDQSVDSAEIRATVSPLPGAMDATNPYGQPRSRARPNPFLQRNADGSLGSQAAKPAVPIIDDHWMNQLRGEPAGGYESQQLTAYQPPIVTTGLRAAVGGDNLPFHKPPHRPYGGQPVFRPRPQPAPAPLKLRDDTDVSVGEMAQGGQVFPYLARRLLAAAPPMKKAYAEDPQKMQAVADKLQGYSKAVATKRAYSRMAMGGVHEGAGEVRGQGGPREDKVPAMYSDGEYVLPAKTVKAMGGPKALDQMVQMTNDGIAPHGAKERGSLRHGGNPDMAYMHDASAGEYRMAEGYASGGNEGFVTPEAERRRLIDMANAPAAAFQDLPGKDMDTIRGKVARGIALPGEAAAAKANTTMLQETNTPYDVITPAGLVGAGLRAAPSPSLVTRGVELAKRGASAGVDLAKRGASAGVDLAKQGASKLRGSTPAPAAAASPGVSLVPRAQDIALETPAQVAARVGANAAANAPSAAPAARPYLGSRLQGAQSRPIATGVLGNAGPVASRTASGPLSLPTLRERSIAARSQNLQGAAPPGDQFGMDNEADRLVSGLRRHRDATGAMVADPTAGNVDLLNRAQALRGSPIRASVENGRMSFSGQGPSKRTYVGVDGKPTSNYEDSQQFAEGTQIAEQERSALRGSIDANLAGGDLERANSLAVTPEDRAAVNAAYAQRSDTALRERMPFRNRQLLEQRDALRAAQAVTLRGQDVTKRGQDLDYATAVADTRQRSASAAIDNARQAEQLKLSQAQFAHSQGEAADKAITDFAASTVEEARRPGFMEFAYSANPDLETEGLTRREHKALLGKLNTMHKMSQKANAVQGNIGARVGNKHDKIMNVTSATVSDIARGLSALKTIKGKLVFANDLMVVYESGRVARVADIATNEDGTYDVDALSILAEAVNKNPVPGRGTLRTKD